MTSYSICLSLVSLGIMPSTSIHVVANGNIFFFFIPVYYSECFFTWVPGQPSMKSSVKEESGSRGRAWATVAQQRWQQSCDPSGGRTRCLVFPLPELPASLAHGPSSTCKAHHPPIWFYWHISFFGLVPHGPLITIWRMTLSPDEYFRILSISGSPT